MALGVMGERPTGSEFFWSIAAWCGGLSLGTLLLMLVFTIPGSIPSELGSKVAFHLSFLVVLFPVAFVVCGTLDVIAQLILGLRKVKSHARGFVVGFSWTVPIQLAVLASAFGKSDSLSFGLPIVSKNPAIATLALSFVFVLFVRWVLSDKQSDA